jgi:hypothetical protein
MNGQWMLNPTFQASAGAAAAAAAGFPQGTWAPYQWNQQQQQQAQAASQQQSFNPYKKVPKPADASYWQTKLQDNGLGLFGMEKK